MAETPFQEVNVSLREYMDLRWSAHTKEHELMEAARAARVMELDRRLNDMNEFRAQIQTERGEFLGKPEYESRHRELEVRLTAAKESQDKRLSLLELAKSNMDGRLWAAGAGFTVLTLLLNFLFHFWQK